MSFTAVIKSILFLCMLFVVLYVGMNNMGHISFSFPVAMKDQVSAPAAIIFFAFFGAGVLAGTLLHSGKKGGSSAKAK